MANFKERLINQALKQLEDSYVKARKGECEEIHNKMVELITESQADPKNVLFVLEILKQEVLQESIDKYFTPSPEKKKENVVEKAASRG